MIVQSLLTSIRIFGIFTQSRKCNVLLVFAEYKVYFFMNLQEGHQRGKDQQLLEPKTAPSRSDLHGNPHFVDHFPPDVCKSTSLAESVQV